MSSDLPEVDVNIQPATPLTTDPSLDKVRKYFSKWRSAVETKLQSAKASPGRKYAMRWLARIRKSEVKPVKSAVDEDPRFARRWREKTEETKRSKRAALKWKEKRSQRLTKGPEAEPAPEAVESAAKDQVPADGQPPPSATVPSSSKETLAIPSSRGVRNKETTKQKNVAPKAKKEDQAVGELEEPVEPENSAQAWAGRLIACCKRGEWSHLDAILKQIPAKTGVDTALVTQSAAWNPVHFAAKENRMNAIEKLLDLGYNDGSTALNIACSHAREDTIRCLLLRKADPMIPGGAKGQMAIHVVCGKTSAWAVVLLQLILKCAPREIRLALDNEGSTPLFVAIEASNPGIVRELLADLAAEQLAAKKPLPTEDGVLHLAVAKRDMDLLKQLLEAGALVNMQNATGQTILHVACTEGLENLVKLLHSVGADPNIRDAEENTPLHIATAKGHFKIVDLLTDKFKASVHLRAKDGSTLMHIASAAGHAATAMAFMKKGVPLHMPNKKGAKAIHLASMRGNVDVVKNVLARGENVDCKTNEGFTALHLAVQAGQPEVVETLLGHGASVYLQAGRSKESPLHVCSRTQNGHHCAELLIKSGSPINDVDETLLQHVNAILSLEAATRLVNQKNKAGESSVHYAASLKAKESHFEYEDRDLVRFLLQAGGDPVLEASETKETAIHYCSKSGNINVLREIIAQLPAADAQVACNKQAKNGWSPLLYAAYYGHPELIKVLLEQNARVDVFDESGTAALHLAADYGHEEVIQLLLANNAFVNVRNKYGLTPLHLAAKKGYKGMLQQLVDNGAVVDALTLIKQTPLHLAAETGQLEVCKTLLLMKADVNALDNLSQSPLHLAAQNDHPDVLKLFLQHKPELVSVPNKNGQTCAHIAAEKGSVAVLKELMKFNVETVKTARIKKTGNTALHLAAEGGHVKVVRQLLQAGSKASDENVEGYTALHLAARHGHLRVLATLKGACDWKLCSRKNGLSALHVAAKYGQAEFVGEMLTQVPAGLKSERALNDPGGDYGITSMHMAAQNGHESTVRLLMNFKGVHVDEPTEVQKSTPMHYAAQGGHLLVAGLIISRSANSLILTDKQGRTCVHLAASAGHKEMVALLLGQGAELNTQDKKMWTPLHYASKYGFLEVVELLCDSGADPVATSKDDKIPLCAAAAAGHWPVINYLLKKEHDTLALMDDRNFMLDLMMCSKNHDNKPIREFILVSEAPIDTAVKLAKCYENLSLKDKERYKDLELACAYCDQVAIDLLSIAATMNNTGSLLRGVDHKNTEFLDVLIELERKDVVSQHAVQRYLTEVWMGRLKWASSSFVIMFFAFLICPIVWVVVSTPIGHSLGKKPIIKFTSYLTSHIFFIVLLTYTTLNIQIPLFEYTSLFPYWFEWLLLIWIVGMLVSELTNPSDRSGLGSIKLVILVISFMALMVHVGAIFAQLFYYDRDLRFVDNEQLYHALYIRNQLFAFALLLSFVEFLNFLTFHPLFGPWGVIIQDLIRDLLLFMAILALFLAGFTLQVCAIYQPVYRPPSNGNGTIPEIGSVFQSPALTFEMLFYALFGLVEPDAMPPMHLNPSFSKYIMKLVFGVYMMVTVIVLINLLIAMMSNTYQRIEAQSDIEWKFGRAKLIRNMNRTMPTPSPINLFCGIPLVMFDKLQKKLADAKSEKEMALAKQAFGHLDQQRPSLQAAKQWLNRRASKASRATSALSQSTRFGGIEAATDELKPIAEVVNWALIVQKYLESLGELTAKEDDEDSQAGDAAEGAVEGGAA
ncbi:Ankyrin-3 [Halotydeus destructor]|nr:Ankyrin-3 [Halotydeus destructor]